MSFLFIITWYSDYKLFLKQQQLLLLLTTFDKFSPESLKLCKIIFWHSWKETNLFLVNRQWASTVQVFSAVIDRFLATKHPVVLVDHRLYHSMVHCPRTFVWRDGDVVMMDVSFRKLQLKEICLKLNVSSCRTIARSFRRHNSFNWQLLICNRDWIYNCDMTRYYTKLHFNNKSI